MNRKYLVAIVFPCMFLILAGSAWGQGNIYMGRVHIQPSISYSLSWDDNIFLEHTSEENDWVQSIKPALELEYQRDADNYMKLFGSIDFNRYDDFSSNDYEEYELIGDGRYTAPSGLFVQVRDRYLETEDPYSTENNYRLGDPQVERWYNLGEVTLGYQPSDNWSIQFKYGNYRLEYNEFRDQWQDRDDNRFSIRGTCRVMPKTSVLLEYRLHEQDYPKQDNLNENNQGIDSDNNQDNTYHQIFTGLAFSPSAKINGEIKLGASKKDYDSHRNWNGQKYNDDWEWAAETMLLYNFSPKTKFLLELMRMTYESTDTEAGSYTSTRGGLGIRQTLWQKFELMADAAYTLEDYDTGAGFPSRDDDIYEFSTGLDYQIKEWLTTGLKYLYQDRSTDSFYEDEEYIQNRITWTLRAEF